MVKYAETFASISTDPAIKEIVPAGDLDAVGGMDGCGIESLKVIHLERNRNP